MRVDEVDRPLGVAGRQLRHVGIGFDDAVALDQGQRRVAGNAPLFLTRPRAHVVGVRQAEIFVEAVVRGEKLLVVAEVPLAEDGRMIAERFEHLGDGVVRCR